MASKKGSVFTGLLVLILLSGVLVRSQRLLTSHLYIEQGIYSIDVRVNAFLKDLRGIEANLNERFRPDEFLAYMKSGKKLRIGSYSVYYKASYNEDTLHLIQVEDTVQRYLRSVEVKIMEDSILLLNKGV